MRLPTRPRRGSRALACFFLVALAAAPSRAQSGDVNFPTPIYSNVVAGRIIPRDVGDPRRTRHFYTFRGTEGDLVVRLVGSNLNGSVDVFAARTLRPLLKITLVGGTTTDATKTVYLREEELLVLRVEARAVGDSEGAYTITLGGSFAPAPAGLAEAPTPELPEAPAGERRAGTRRVTTTGARIDEPPPAQPEQAREEARAESPSAREAEAGEAVTPARPARRSNTRRGGRTAGAARNRGRTPPGSQPSEAARPEAEAGPTTPATGEAGQAAGEAAPSAGVAETPAERAPASRRNRGRNARTGRRAAGEGTAPAAGGEASAEATVPAGPRPNAAAQPAAPQRLVITTSSGETIEYEMSAVRRMAVENNQLVVTTRDGRTVRRPMTNVLRVSIEPAPQP
ncbi:MAG TPA: hypothetical protein VEY09_07390 [Pyrinomonadaceae bacterium]|nr:hypothetical protein [Pyrinomonadaceae bacterium]